VPCRVADWRLVFEEPADIKVGPVIPEDSVWKLTPTAPSCPRLIRLGSGLVELAETFDTT
jgi:hypothetical protein